MLDRMNAYLELLECLAWLEEYFFLRQHGPTVHAFIRDEMDHDAAAIDFAALPGLESTLDGMCAGKRSGQGRMKVDHTIWEA